jgi:uncharacterized protein (DUF4415 family)
MSLRLWHGPNASKKPFVGLRLAEEDLDAYKALGKGYTGIMSDILSYAIKHPEILAKAQ